MQYRILMCTENMHHLDIEFRERERKTPKQFILRGFHALEHAPHLQVQDWWMLKEACTKVSREPRRFYIDQDRQQLARSAHNDHSIEFIFRQDQHREG